MYSINFYNLLKKTSFLYRCISQYFLKQIKYINLLWRHFYLIFLIYYTIRLLYAL